MTYCLAVKLDSGIVFASDSRTNAGVDQISTYSKMNSFCVPGQRLFVLLSAGNLATTQAVVNLIRRDLEDPAAETSLKSVDYMFDAALYVGQTSSRVQERHRDPENNGKANLEATFILGGQIKDQPHDIYLVYPEGPYSTSCYAQTSFSLLCWLRTNAVTRDIKLYEVALLLFAIFYQFVHDTQFVSNRL